MTHYQDMTYNEDITLPFIMTSHIMRTLHDPLSGQPRDEPAAWPDSRLPGCTGTARVQVTQSQPFRTKLCLVNLQV